MARESAIVSLSSEGGQEGTDLGEVGEQSVP
jgi:hypothetical protein